MEEQDLEISNSSPPELDWSEEDWEEELREEYVDEFLGWEAFNRGEEAGASSKGLPCSTVFLDELLHNLCLWNVQLVYSMETYHDLDTDLDDDTKVVVEYIYGAMDECTRLRLHPELFVSEEVRLEFLAQVTTIAENIMGPLSKVAKRMDLLANISRHDHTIPRSKRVRKVGGVYYRIRNPKIKDQEGFHRSKTDKKPWNKWLNNRARPGMGIEQRIPDTGHRMLRRVQYMYRCIETSFRKTGRVLREGRDTTFLARATGEDYSLLLSPPTHPHLRVPLNFYTDISSQFKNDGAVKLEAIGIACALFQQRQLMPRRAALMCQVVSRN